MEMQVDCEEELVLADVKTKLKKSMGADYDMGSNSRCVPTTLAMLFEGILTRVPDAAIRLTLDAGVIRSADGKEGNAGSAFAPTKYSSNAVEIQAKAKAAYKGMENAPKAMVGIGGGSTKAASAVKSGEPRVRFSFRALPLVAI